MSGYHASPPYSDGLEVTVSSDPEVRQPSQHGYHYAPRQPPLNPVPLDSPLGNTAAFSEKQPFPKRQSRGPCGLSGIIFACLLALLTAFIVGAALGGGLGGSLAHKETENKAFRQSLAAAATASYSPSPTHSASTTATTSATAATSSASQLQNYSVPNPSTINTVKLDCPDLTGQSYITVNRQTFDLTCGINAVGYDMVAIVAYAWVDCVEACASMNRLWGNVTFCTTTSFLNTIDLYYATEHANCW